jgi:hypothetical protein
MMPTIASSASGVDATAAGGRGCGGCDAAEAGASGGFPAVLLAATGAARRPAVDANASGVAGLPAADGRPAEAAEDAGIEGDALDALAIVLAGAAGLFLPPAVGRAEDSGAALPWDGDPNEGEVPTVQAPVTCGQPGATSGPGLGARIAAEAGPVPGGVPQASEEATDLGAPESFRIPGQPAAPGGGQPIGGSVVAEAGTEASPKEASAAHAGQARDADVAVVARAISPRETRPISPDLAATRPQVQAAMPEHVDAAAPSAGLESPASAGSRTPRPATNAPSEPAAVAPQAAVSDAKADRGALLRPDSADGPSRPSLAAPLAGPMRRGNEGAHLPAWALERGDPGNTPLADRSTSVQATPFPAARETVAADGDRDRRPLDAAAHDTAQGPERGNALLAARTVGSPTGRDVDAPAREALSTLNVDRLVSAARVSLARGGMEVRLRLHPEAFGEVQVEVRWEGGVLSARLEAATPAARDALEGGAGALRAVLQDQGIPVERLSVGLRMDLHAGSQERSAASAGEGSRESTAALSTPAEPERTPEPAVAGRLDVRI